MKLSNLTFPVYGNTDFRGKCPNESQEQVTFFNRLRKEYPDTWGVLAIHPRNEQLLKGGQFRGVIKQKAEGMTKGATDIVIPARVSFVCELKRLDHTQSKWQDGQLHYIETAQSAGAFACVALGYEAAWLAFQDWVAATNTLP